MNYQLIALDMDGTVLNSQKEISPRTADAIHKAFEQGYEVLFSTGRNVSEVRDQLAQFPEMRYLICCSGAVVKDLRTGKNLSTATVDFDIANRVSDAVKNMEVNVTFFIGDDLFLSKKVRGNMEYYNCQCFHNLYESCAVWVDDPYAVMRANPKDILKINLFFHDHNEYLHVGEILNELSINHASGIPDNYEVSPANVSKGTGLKVLCDHLGISVEQAIACGDEGNDRDIILTAGLGVAMGNANDAIKEIADVVVADCDHDGVAEAIEKYLGKPVLEGKKQ